MAKNLSREFATMSEDERRQFALEEEEGTRDQPAELDFEEPRHEDAPSAQHRDGMSAVLDEQQHKEALRKAAQPKDSTDKSE
jgi:hypothetical protein